MGKKAVPVAYLTGDQNRRNTFKKRLVGLMKKAHDLSILCGAQIALVVVDESGEISPYTMNTKNESIEDVWAQYACSSEEAKVRRLSTCKQLLKSETNKAEVARQAKKDTNQEPQDCGLHKLDRSNMFGTQQNQTNQGSISSTVQCEPNVNAMVSPIGPNMNNEEVYLENQQHGMGNGHYGVGNGHYGVGNGHYGVGNGHYGVSNGHYGVGNVHYGVGNVHYGVGNVQYGVGNVHYGVGNQQCGMGNQQCGIGNQQCGVGNQQCGMGTHQNQGVEAHQQQHGAYQENGANLQHTYPHISPNETNSFEEEGPTSINSPLLDYLISTNWDTPPT